MAILRVLGWGASAGRRWIQFSTLPISWFSLIGLEGLKPPGCY